MIGIATLLCDRKQSSQLIGIPAAMKLDTTGIEGGVRYYVNIESGYCPDDFRRIYEPLLQLIDRSEPQIACDVDTWQWRTGRFRKRTAPWRLPPQYDQDQRRLQSICVARNMAREFALATGASHLFFIDADVIVPPDALKRLLALDHPLAGGLVPGRGAHSHVKYVFGISHHRYASNNYELAPECSICKQSKRHAIHHNEGARMMPMMLPDHPGVIEVEHGTCGCLLIRRDLLSTLAFRSGLNRIDMKTGISEDPAYAADAFLNGFGRWWIDTNVKCQHWDDPVNPMTEDQVSRDYAIPK